MIEIYKLIEISSYSNQGQKFIPISGLQMTDVELDARVTALEENGGGNTQNCK